MLFRSVNITSSPPNFDYGVFAIYYGIVAAAGLTGNEITSVNGLDGLAAVHYSGMICLKEPAAAKSSLTLGIGA